MVVAGSGGPSVVLDAVAEFLEAALQADKSMAASRSPVLDIDKAACWDGGLGAASDELITLCKLAQVLEPQCVRLAKTQKTNEKKKKRACKERICSLYWFR